MIDLCKNSRNYETEVERSISLKIVQIMKKKLNDRFMQ